MLNFLCFFALFNAVKTYTNLSLHHMGGGGEKLVYYLTYQDEIQNLEGYIFKKCFTIEKVWDELPVFTQETIYHVRTEMRQNLMFILHFILFLQYLRSYCHTDVTC